jgi:hypothetical protein
MACVAFVVAPTVFRTLEDDTLAGRVMAPIFRMVDLYGIGAALIFALVARRRRAIVALAAGAAAAVNAFLVGPRIAARAEGWEFLHHVSTGLWLAILIVGFILALLGPTTRD